MLRMLELLHKLNAVIQKYKKSIDILHTPNSYGVKIMYIPTKGILGLGSLQITEPCSKTYVQNTVLYYFEDVYNTKSSYNIYAHRSVYNSCDYHIITLHHNPNVLVDGFYKGKYMKGLDLDWLFQISTEFDCTYFEQAFELDYAYEFMYKDNMNYNEVYKVLEDLYEKYTGKS